MIRGLADLVSYLHAFHGSWSASPGLPASDVPADLPDALATLYREFGALIALEPTADGGHRTPFGTQDALVPVHRLKRIDGMVEFAWENQGNWSCRSPLGPGDPPVFSNAATLWDEPTSGFQRVCDSLSHFLVTLSLQEAVMSAPCLFQFADDAPVTDAFAPQRTPLWLQGHYVFGDPSHSFFELSGEDVLIMEYAGVWVASHSEYVLSLVNPGIRLERCR